MSVTLELCQVVERAHSLARILEGATRVIAQRLRVDGCFVFLLDEHGDLRSAAAGSDPSGPRADAGVESIAAQAFAERRAAAARGETTSLLACPMLLRDSTVGAVVLQSAVRRDYSAEDIGTLATICRAAGRDRRERANHRRPRSRRATRTPGRTPLAVHGGAGRRADPSGRRGVARRRDRDRRLSRRLSPGPLRARPARGRCRRGACARASRDREDAERRLEDPDRGGAGDRRSSTRSSSRLTCCSSTTRCSSSASTRRSRRGASAPRRDRRCASTSSRHGCASYRTSTSRSGSTTSTICASRLARPRARRGRRAHASARGSWSLTSRIPPSLVVELKTEGARALVTETGGATSHGVLLARAMGIPGGHGDRRHAGRRCGPMTGSSSTGRTAWSWCAPPRRRSPATRRSAAASSARAPSTRSIRDVLARTADGVRVALYANVGVASDLAVARENGAEGVGLYRTEFPFIVRDAFPTRDGAGEDLRARRTSCSPPDPIHFRDPRPGRRQVRRRRARRHGAQRVPRVSLDPRPLRSSGRAARSGAGARHRGRGPPAPHPDPDGHARSRSCAACRTLIGEALAASTSRGRRERPRSG